MCRSTAPAPTGADRRTSDAPTIDGSCSDRRQPVSAATACFRSVSRRSDGFTRFHSTVLMCDTAGRPGRGPRMQPFPTSPASSRRSILKTALLGAAAPIIAVRSARAAAPQSIEMQLGWIGGGNQLGEVAALQLGYFKDEGLDLTIVPGGPNNDGIAGVASGRSAVGQVSSSPSLMLAASQDLPIRCFAVAAQKHPYAFFSLAKNPVHTAADLRGKKIGIQATGLVLLRALLAKNNMRCRTTQRPKRSNRNPTCSRVSSAPPPAAGLSRTTIAIARSNCW